jgi:hypothetical protein
LEKGFWREEKIREEIMSDKVEEYKKIKNDLNKIKEKFIRNNEIFKYLEEYINKINNEKITKEYISEISKQEYIDKYKNSKYKNNNYITQERIDSNTEEYNYVLYKIITDIPIKIRKDRNKNDDFNNYFNLELTKIISTGGRNTFDTSRDIKIFKDELFEPLTQIFEKKINKEINEIENSFTKKIGRWLRESSKDIVKKIIAAVIVALVGLFFMKYKENIKSPTEKNQKLKEEKNSSNKIILEDKLKNKKK